MSINMIFDLKFYLLSIYIYLLFFVPLLLSYCREWTIAIKLLSTADWPRGKRVDI